MLSGLFLFALLVHYRSVIKTKNAWIYPFVCRSCLKHQNQRVYRLSRRQRQTATSSVQIDFDCWVLQSTSSDFGRQRQASTYWVCQLQDLTSTARFDLILGFVSWPRDISKPLQTLAWWTCSRSEFSRQVNVYCTIPGHGWGIGCRQTHVRAYSYVDTCDEKTLIYIFSSADKTSVQKQIQSSMCNYSPQCHSQKDHWVQQRVQGRNDQCCPQHHLNGITLCNHGNNINH